MIGINHTTDQFQSKTLSLKRIGTEPAQHTRFLRIIIECSQMRAGAHIYNMCDIPRRMLSSQGTCAKLQFLNAPFRRAPPRKKGRILLFQCLFKSRVSSDHRRKVVSGWPSNELTSREEGRERQTEKRKYSVIALRWGEKGRKACL